MLYGRMRVNGEGSGCEGGGNWGRGLGKVGMKVGKWGRIGTGVG